MPLRRRRGQPRVLTDRWWVGSIVGSGVFVLPRRFGAETGVLGA